MQVQQAVQAQILQGDALDVLRSLPAESVQCVVTSPPYFGLRDYGTAEWDGGEEDCDHANGKARQDATNGRANSATFHGSMSTDHGGGATHFRDECGKCGATRIDRQIGLESTPAEYVAKMVAVFREVRRVLRKGGVCWLNIGDSYASSGAGSWGSSDKSTLTTGSKNGAWAPGKTVGTTPKREFDGLKPKDLCGMPWRLAFALQADGWYLRQDIIWHKPNPMPESVTDRCTKSHEYIFLLSKSERYFYNADAVSEPASESTHARLAQNVAAQIGSDRAHAGNKTNGPMRALTPGRKLAEVGSGTKNNESFDDAMAIMPERRNRRSVWTMVTEGYSEAHFATFPTELPRICILAGSKIGDTILDPFAGSGTTLQVALELSRAAIGIELNADYVALANRRLNSTTLGLPLEIAA